MTKGAAVPDRLAAAGLPVPFSAGATPKPASTNVIDAYRSRFDFMNQEGRFRDQPDDLRRLREDAMDRFIKLGFPTTRMEAWRNTNVEPLARIEFQPPVANGAIELQAVAPFFLEGSLRAVVADGKFVPELSSLNELPKGVEIRGLADALTHMSDAVMSHLGRYAEFKDQAFVALNTAFFSDGVFISVPNGMVLERPVQVLYLSSSRDETTVVHPRTLVLAGENSQLTIMEQVVDLASETSLVNAVTEIVAGPGAVIEYTQVRQGAEGSFSIATLETYQLAQSQVTLHSATVQGGLTRNDVHAALAGEGAEVILNGLYLARGRQHVDNHTRIDHIAPHCTSRENYKGILDDHAHGVFNGRIVVHPDAQKTQASQSNKNLMLSDHALVNTNPQLEIYADDVKCTHGSTVGQVDDEAIFYCQSRGIDRETAQRLLIHGFTNEIINQVKNEAIRAILESMVADWLSQDNNL